MTMTHVFLVVGRSVVPSILFSAHFSSSSIALPGVDAHQKKRDTNGGLGGMLEDVGRSCGRHRLAAPMLLTLLDDWQAYDCS